MKRALLGAAVLAAALLLVAGAGATTPPQATGVTAAGAFSHPVPNPANPGSAQLCGASGQPTCASIGYPMPPSVQVRWGSPGSSNGESGLGFGSLAPPSVGVGQNFVVGSLSHFNWPVFGALSSVDLTVTLDAQTADGPIHFSLPFTLGIDETPNGTTAASCNPAYQPIVTPCPDAIKLPPGGGTFVSQTLNTHTYTLTVVGFTTSQTDLSHPASLLITQEGQVTQGFLVANLSRSNAAPVAHDDTATATSGGSSGPIDVLANDSDADGDMFAPTVSTPPAHGTATVNADGTITYVADANFAGVDHFAYTDSDGIDTSAPADVAVTVTDTTKPAITVPSGGATAEATGPAGAAVTYDVSATDNVDASVTVHCVPPSGSTFPVGTTTVHCTAADAAGNTAEATFDVTVADTTAPALSGVPSDATVEATGPGGAPVTYAPPTATDLVDGAVAVDCLPASGSTFHLGANTVTCTATDHAGNTATGTFTITVQDTTKPTLDLPADMTVFSSGGTAVAVTYTATATDLVDGSVSVTCTPASGSRFDVGTATVQCDATDAAGNTAHGSFTVTVVPNRPPVCTDVRALGAANLWPANHKLVLITLAGASDPDGNSFTYRIDGVTQDEPLTGGGTGGTAFDAQHASGGSVYLRAERAGSGDGRVYTIAYTVTDQYGLSCSSTIDVKVPHDAAHDAVKSAGSYNSFGG